MEAQFLQSQSERLTRIAEREKARRSEESISLAAAAEAALDSRWSEFRRRIGEIEQLTDPPLMEDERRRLRLSFHELQETLNTQRREVSLNDYLSDVILLRWHKHLVTGQAKLDNLQGELLPKGKFIFRRYRQALANRQAEDDASEDKKTTDPSSSKSFMDDIHVHCLEDLESKSISIDEETVQIISDTADLRQKLDFDEGGVPLVWRRLQKCSIKWQSTNTKNSTKGGGDVLHLIELADCQLEISATLSSIHVTDCHNVTLRISRVQQVRLHTSKQVQVWGQITGGAILESCHQIGITSNCPNAQDFNWLKASRPSPNLERLIEEAPSEQSTEISKIYRTQYDPKTVKKQEETPEFANANNEDDEL